MGGCRPPASQLTTPLAQTDKQSKHTARRSAAATAAGGFAAERPTNRRSAVGIGIPMGMGMGGYGDDRPSPQTHGDSMGIFNQPEITR